MDNQTTGTEAASSLQKLKVLNRNSLKYIVIIAMLIDHIAWGFSAQIGRPTTDFMHLIGRLTGPTMAFFLTEGYIHTSNRSKYQLRLGIFALISWIPFFLFEASPDITKRLPLLILQSVIYTLFLGITALRVWDSQRFKKPVKILLIILLSIVSLIGDWPVMDVLCPLFLYINKDKKIKKYISVSIVYAVFIGMMVITDFEHTWYNMGVILVPIMLKLFYNGEPGKKTSFNKWFFYIFYPAHLLILAILKIIISEMR